MDQFLKKKVYGLSLQRWLGAFAALIGLIFAGIPIWEYYFPDVVFSVPANQSRTIETDLRTDILELGENSTLIVNPKDAHFIKIDTKKLVVSGAGAKIEMLVKAGADGQSGESGKNGVDTNVDYHGKPGEDGRPGEKGEDAKDIVLSIKGEISIQASLLIVARGGNGGNGGDGGNGGHGERGSRTHNRDGGNGGKGGDGGKGGAGGTGGLVEIHIAKSEEEKFRKFITVDSSGGDGGVPGRGGKGGAAGSGRGGVAFGMRETQSGRPGTEGHTDKESGSEGMSGRYTLNGRDVDKISF